MLDASLHISVYTGASVGVMQSFAHQKWMYSFIHTYCHEIQAASERKDSGSGVMIPKRRLCPCHGCFHILFEPGPTREHSRIAPLPIVSAGVIPRCGGCSYEICGERVVRCSKLSPACSARCCDLRPARVSSVAPRTLPVVSTFRVYYVFVCARGRGKGYRSVLTAQEKRFIESTYVARRHTKKHCSMCLTLILHALY